MNLLKGKTVYSPVNISRPIECVLLPPHILKTHPSDSLDIDFMYCQGAPYLLMKTQVTKFQAIQSFNRISRIIQRTNSRRITYKRGPNDIINGIEKVRFTVRIINADNEFQKIENRVSAHLEICAAGQHIPRIERGIRSVKDRTRCFWVGLTFKKAPKIMVDECLIMVIACLNDFPNKNGISQTLSPASIILGRGKINGNHLKATFGRYYEVYCGTDSTNKERRTSAICLHPSNSQGGYYFLSLETGKKIQGYKFTELAMPNQVIDHIHELAEEEGAENLDDDGCPIFEWELGTPIRNITANDNPRATTIDIDNINDDDTNKSIALSEDDSNESDDESDNDNDNDNDDSNNDSEINNSNDDEDIMDDDQVEDDDESLSDPSDASTLSENNTPNVDNPQEFRSGNTMQEIRSKRHSSDDDLSASEFSTNDANKDNNAININSEINQDNIMEEGRSRRPTQPANIGSFASKKYHVNFLNIDNKKFKSF